MSQSPSKLDIEIPGLDQLMIAGEWVKPARDHLVDVIMPSTEQVIARVADPSIADADRAAAAARQALKPAPGHA